LLLKLNTRKATKCVNIDAKTINKYDKRFEHKLNKDMTKPTVCEKSRYGNDKQQIEQQITNKKHFGKKDYPVPSTIH
jgi:hypothetical protein